MVSAVKLRPNHYATLGLEPAASDDDIKQAFARMMSLFRARPVSAIAQVSAAYATLRDPDRRKEYDRSLGLRKPAEPRQWNFALSQPQWSPFVASAGFSGVGQGISTAAQPREPHVTAEPEPALEPQVACPEQLVEEIRTIGRAERRELQAGARQSSDWRKPAMAAGGLVVGVGILGALAGVSLPRGEQPAAVSVPLPVATQSPGFSALLAAAANDQPKVRATGTVAAAKSVAPRRPRLTAEEEIVPAPSVTRAPDPGSVGEVAGDPLAPQADVQQSDEAAMPLPKAVVARTIERIGYACGDVVSTAAVGGAGSGVFKVICSSGNAYQATPVHGRYRFRRLG